MYQSNFRAIHHIAIISSNYEAAKNFYNEILGFPIIRENIRPDKGDIKIDLSLNELTEIEIFIKNDAPERPSYPEALGLRHLALQTNNIERDLDYLKSFGIKVTDISLDDYTKKKMAFFFDPDNLPIELHE